MIDKSRGANERLTESLKKSNRERNELRKQLENERAKLTLAKDALIEAKKPEHFVYVAPNKMGYVKVIDDALTAMQRKG